jgi:CheY-like chemotaxis protein
VWVVDAGEKPPALSELKSVVGVNADLDLPVVLVIVGRGQRRNLRAEADGIIMIDGNALNRRKLNKAVATAAGRVLPEPEAPSRPHGATTARTTSRDEALRQHRLILVAEDNEINQRVIRRQLDLLGYMADIAATGREALQRCQSGGYALLLTDLHMPEMDGYDLAAQIRAAEGNRARMPIIALTANALKGESERCLAIGMDGYLSKPTTLAALAATLEKWLPTTGSASMLTDSSAPLQLGVLEGLVGTDPRLIENFLKLFAVSAGRAASELATACERGRTEAAAQIAHKLKSSARSVGALRLGEVCAAIEVAGSTGDPARLAELLPGFEREMSLVDSYLHSLGVDDDAIERPA